MGRVFGTFSPIALGHLNQSAWEMSLTTDELPNFEQLRNFIKRRCRSICRSVYDQITAQTPANLHSRAAPVTNVIIPFSTTTKNLSHRPALSHI